MAFGNKLDDLFCYGFGEPYKIVIGSHNKNDFDIKRAKKYAISRIVKAVFAVVKLLENETEINSSVINLINASLCSLNQVLNENKGLLELLSDNQLYTYKKYMHAINDKLTDIQETLINELDETLESIKANRSCEESVEENTDSNDE